MSLSGKVAVVTGGTRGIGKEICKRLAADGATLAVIGTRSESVDPALKEYHDLGYTSAKGYVLNVANKDGAYVKVNVSGKVVRKELLLANTKQLGNNWKTVIIPIKIDRGANTILIESLGDQEVLIDEIVIK